MRNCPNCGEKMEQDDPQDDSPVDSWTCSTCGHNESSDESDEVEELLSWDCPNCDNEKGPVIDGFCTHCGEDIDPEGDAIA